VLECGVGGRLDATNIVKEPLCVALTSVGLDHTDKLGETLPEIAGEKAMVIKKGVKGVVLSPTCYTDPEVFSKFESQATAVGALDMIHKIPASDDINEINTSIVLKVLECISGTLLESSDSDSPQPGNLKEQLLQV